jgi:hypothetical protein
MDMQGDYRVQLKAKDDEGNILFCMLVDFSINGPSFTSFANTIRENMS